MIGCLIIRRPHDIVNPAIKERADIVYHFKIRASLPGFPHGYGTTGYTELFRQLNLGHPMLFPKLL
jgi:hypothetical protein